MPMRKSSRWACTRCTTELVRAGVAFGAFPCGLRSASLIPNDQQCLSINKVLCAFAPAVERRAEAGQPWRTPWSVVLGSAGMLWRHSILRIKGKATCQCVCASYDSKGRAHARTVGPGCNSLTLCTLGLSACVLPLPASLHECHDGCSLR